ncbi:unnamed protein product [Moneuplotes crassus]|uniref:RNase III domain-containing protein n=1 Tax=Euplotes crassus TaxID=5936 RepID=A0AAD1UMQ0_EUPCR|nr:unnamed protein product [Moneuplotes crassus]
MEDSSEILHSQDVYTGSSPSCEDIWAREARFLKEIYYPLTDTNEMGQREIGSQEKEALESLAIHLGHLGDQTDRFKSIIEDSEPKPEDDMPILHYQDHSEYIVNGFDANEGMSTLEVFTDKWDRYTKERNSKETNKECLKEEFFYRSNRMPELLTSQFQVVQNSSGEKRVKAYLTVFIPLKKIECEIENQRYQPMKESEIPLKDKVVYGILSPQCPGEIPDVRFYTNHLRSSTGFEYWCQTIDKPLYIKDFGKVEYFMNTIMRDIYKYQPNEMFKFSDDPISHADSSREEALKGLPLFKNYFFVPINMKSPVEYAEDIIDWEYIDMIKEIHDKGVYTKSESLYDVYKRLTHPDSGLTIEEAIQHFHSYVEDNIFIKGNKPHCLYVNLELVEDLRTKDATDFAEQLKVNVGSKTFTSAFDLIDSGKANSSTLKHFKEYCLSPDGLGYSNYMTGPVVVADFIKNPKTLKLRFLSVDLAIKNKRKFYNEAKPPGVSGRPILSLYDVYPYFMDKEQWLHCCFLQILGTHYERCSYVTELANGVGLDVNCIDLHIATNSKGTSSDVNLEPLETYGDTVLKFAATWLAYEVFKNDSQAGENEICERRNCFLTNKELFRVGVTLNLRRYIRTLDGDITNWIPPFTKLSGKFHPSKCFFVETKYTGKNIADCAEALIASYMFNGGVKHALKFIAKIGTVPLEKSGLLDAFPDSPLSFNIGNPQDFKVKIYGNFEEVFREYCLRHKPNESIIHNFEERIKVKKCEPLGSAYKHMGRSLINTQVGRDEWTNVLVELESILDYKFKNIKYLKEALIHESYYSTHCRENYDYMINYEKLEVLGDAVLDVIVNSSLAAFAMERNVSPFEIHHSKARLVNNELLCKITCFYGIHRFILSGLSRCTIPEEQIQDLFTENKTTSTEGKYCQEFFNSIGSRESTFWDHKSNPKRKPRSSKRQKQGMFTNLDPKIVGLVMDKNPKSLCLQLYLEDFEPNFVFCSDFEPFETLQKKIHRNYYEAPKMIPDVFEAILGAVFVDGGYNEVVRVLQHTLGPFVCMMAKYFDGIRKNPIEEFNLYCSSKGLVPRIEMFKMGAKQESNPYHSDGDQILGYPPEEQPEGKPLVYYKCAIFVKGKKQLCKSYGNSKEQAKKNACALGFSILKEEFERPIQDFKSQDTSPVQKSPNQTKPQSPDATNILEISEKKEENESDAEMSEESDDIYAGCC